MFFQNYHITIFFMSQRLSAQLKRHEVTISTFSKGAIKRTALLDLNANNDTFPK